MAYDSNNLSALTYANGFTLWHYRTQDTPVAVLEPSYFNDAACMLREGDFIFVNARLNAARIESGTVSVSNNRDGKVAVEWQSGFRLSLAEAA